jgi:hypothetical protein
LHHHQAKQHPQDEDPILHAVLDSIRIIARREQIGEENLYLFLTLLFSICPVFVCTSGQASRQYGHRQRHDQHRLGSATTNVTLATPSPARLDDDIMPRATSTWQRHDQHCLGSAIASMTWHQHHITDKSPWHHHRQHDSTTTLPCDQHRLNSTVTSVTRGLGVCFPD